MSYKKTCYKKTAESVIKNLNRRNMTGYYCENSADAVKKVLELIPKGSSIAWGGSESIGESGIMDAIHNGDYELIDRAEAKTPQEHRAMYARIVCSDYYLMSSNAVTLDGELVNVDGNANRVACLCQGPQHVILVVGMNKIAATVEDAIHRIHTCACPPNAIRVGAETPCSKTGVCADCLSPDCICCQTVITRKSRHNGRIIVLLVGEELGF